MPQDTTGRSLTYRPDVDGLRALAVIAVIGFHAFPNRVQGGFVGVDVFFVISGYLITGILLKSIEKRDFSYFAFYANRIRRIFPALTLVLLAAMALGWWVLLPDEFRQLGLHVVGGAFFFSNLLLWREAGYFDVAAETKPLLHLWSLGVEEQFYILWPIVLAFIWRVCKSPVMVIGLIGAGSFLLNVGLISGYPTATFYMPFTRLWELVIGGMLAAASMRGDPIELWGGRNLMPSAADAIRNTFSVVGLAAVALSIMLLDKRAAFPGFLALGPTIGAALILAAGPQAWLNKHILSARAAVFVGLISYPLYLWHWPLLSYLHIVYIEDVQTSRLLRIGAIFLAVIAATATYRLCEYPLRHRFKVNVLAVPLSLALSVTSAVGVGLIAVDGFPSRTPISTNPLIEPATQTARCSDKYGQPSSSLERPFCVETDPTRAPDVVLIGDSQAHALTPGLDSAFAANGRAAVLMIGAPGCPFLRRTRFWTDTEPQRKDVCPLLIDGAYRAVQTLNPQAVVLNSRLAYYVSGAEFDEHAISSPHFDSLDFPKRTPTEFFEALLERDLVELLKGGRMVLLALQIPEIDFDPRRCLRARPIERYFAPAVSCVVPRKRVEARQAAYREVVSKVASRIASPRLKIVDPMEALCDKASCYAMKDGILLYRDTNHLSMDGARYVWSRLKGRGY